MKKWAALFGGILMVFLCTLFAQGYLAVPEIAGLDPALGIGENRNGYIAGGNKNSLDIYEVNYKGKIIARFPLKTRDTDIMEEIIKIRYADHAVYCLSEQQSLGTDQTLLWVLYRISLPDGAVTELGTVDYTMLSQVLDLEIQNGQAVICGITENEKYLALYMAPLSSSEQSSIGPGLTESEPAEKNLMELKRMEKIPDGETVSEGVFQNEVIFLRTDGGKVGKYLVGGFSKILQETIRERGRLFHGTGDVWYYDRHTEQLRPLTGQPTSVILIPSRLQFFEGEIENNQSFLVFGVNSAGRQVLWCGENQKMIGYEGLSASAKVCLELAKPYIPGTAAGLLLVVVGVWLVWRAYGKNGRISLQLSVLTLVFAVILAGVWLLFLKSSGIALFGQKRRIFISLAVLVCMILVYSGFVEGITRPLRSLGRFMDKVAAGSYEIKKTCNTNNEIGRIWSSLNRMCAELEKKRYHTDMQLRSYYRFVPRDMEKILGRQSIFELQNGDVTEVKGNVTIVSVQNRDNIRSKTDDQVYMKIVGYCFGLIRETGRRHGAVMASNEFDLSGIRVLYPDVQRAAVPFGIELLTANREKQMGSLLKADMFLMLHKTGYLYGLAGDEEQAFPFFASGEVEFLESKVSGFRGTQVGMVMTGQAFEQTDFNCDSRYIGYLTYAEGNMLFRIYEILDVCPYAERTMKKKLNGDFQKALQLYYENNFYLARNQFSAIVKECPYDGIARWYLFASEYYFNLGDLSKVNYGLFSGDYTDKAGGLHEFTV